MGSILCGIQNHFSYFEARIMSITIKETDQPLIVLQDPRGQGREDTPFDNQKAFQVQTNWKREKN